MTISANPQPQAVQPGTPIRFAVAGPSGGCSRTWAVISGTSEAELFLGTGGGGVLRMYRRRDGWRLEYTPEHARRDPAVGRRRQLSRLAPPAEDDGDWQRALSVVVPSDPAPPSGTPDALCWPPPPPGAVTQFDVLIGTPGHWRLPGEFAAEVGRTALAGAGAVWVVMHYPELTERGLADLHRRRDELPEDGPGWTAAVSGADGSVVVFDLG
jgi:hypothetical protein